MTAIAYLAMATAASAATTDLKEQRIPNRLVFPVMILALLGHTVQHGLPGLAFAGLGWLAGLLVFFLPFVFGAMGAGDCKLMAALGALMGWRFILITAFYTALAGFFIAMGILIKKKNWLQKPLAYLPSALSIPLSKILLSKGAGPDSATEGITPVKKERTMIPYGLSIAVGVFLVLVGRSLGSWPLMHLL